MNEICSTEHLSPWVLSSIDEGFWLTLVSDEASFETLTPDEVEIVASTATNPEDVRSELLLTEASDQYTALLLPKFKTLAKECDELFELRRMKKNEIAGQERFIKYLNNRRAQTRDLKRAYEEAAKDGEHCQHVIDFLANEKQKLVDRLEKEETVLERYKREHLKLDRDWNAKGCDKFPPPKKKWRFIV